MSRQEIRVLWLVGLFVGISSLYFGATGLTAGPASVVGQATAFNQFQAEVDVGAIVIIVSAVGLAASLRRRKTTRGETA